MYGQRLKGRPSSRLIDKIKEAIGLIMVGIELVAQAKTQCIWSALKGYDSFAWNNSEFQSFESSLQS